MLYEASDDDDDVCVMYVVYCGVSRKRSYLRYWNVACIDAMSRDVMWCTLWVWRGLTLAQTETE